MVALALLPVALWAQSSGPSYTAAGLVDFATNTPGPLAPNSWVVLNGSNLSFSPATAGPGDMVNNQLPVKLRGASAQVLLAGGTRAPLLSVSATQIVFLIPGSRSPGNTSLTVVRDGLSGPSIPVTIADVAPAIFQHDSLASATHFHGTPVTADTPARPGERIAVYANGLGQTVVPLDSRNDGAIVPITSDINTIRIRRFAELAVTLNDQPLDPAAVFWAGLTIGTTGVYQVNLQLPDELPLNPIIKVWIGNQGSQDGVMLATLP
jgi:uncharacterized protein (TIGR03437 family)